MGGPEEDLYHCWYVGTPVSQSGVVSLSCRALTTSIAHGLHGLEHGLGGGIEPEILVNISENKFDFDVRTHHLKMVLVVVGILKRAACCRFVCIFITRASRE